MDVADFLYARIAEDEALASDATAKTPHWFDQSEETMDGENLYYAVEERGRDGSMIADLLDTRERGRAAAAHIARYDPARILAECAAKRRIIAEHTIEGPEPWMQNCTVCDTAPGTYETSPKEWPCPTLRALVGIYADHPDYREEWQEDDL